jgi:predicted GNAT family acetyltransferase
MRWAFTTDPAEYMRHAEPNLRLRPVENTFALSMMADLAAGMPVPDGAIFGWCSEQNAAGQPRFAGAVHRTPPYPLLLSDVTAAAADTLFEQMHGNGRDIPRLSGESRTVHAVANKWCQVHGGASTLVMAQRLFRLGTLELPTVPGSARQAGDTDVDMVGDWFAAFADEAGAPAPQRHRIADRLAAGLVMLWLDIDRRPVSLAGLNRTAAGTARVGPVYTPPEQRGHGYGSAVTAAATRHALDSGASDVVLFTDLANPTSNSIYTKLGYAPVEDHAVVSLHRPATSMSA